MEDEELGSFDKTVVSYIIVFANLGFSVFTVLLLLYLKLWEVARTILENVTKK